MKLLNLLSDLICVPLVSFGGHTLTSMAAKKKAKKVAKKGKAKKATKKRR